MYVYTHATHLLNYSTYKHLRPLDADLRGLHLTVVADEGGEEGLALTSSSVPRGPPIRGGALRVRAGPLQRHPLLPVCGRRWLPLAASARVRVRLLDEWCDMRDMTC